jgi:hypothetical protein
MQVTVQLKYVIQSLTVRLTNQVSTCGEGPGRMIRYTIKSVQANPEGGGFTNLLVIKFIKNSFCFFINFRNKLIISYLTR